MNYCQTCSVMLGPVKPIVLELTERQHIVSLDKLRADLQPFIDFGFRLALDDFGSGYSSYLYLAHLPVSFLKIEGWLVSNMRQDRKVAGIVESLANFARKEGVRPWPSMSRTQKPRASWPTWAWTTVRAGISGARSWCKGLEWKRSRPLREAVVAPPLSATPAREHAPCIASSHQTRRDASRAADRETPLV